MLKIIEAPLGHPYTARTVVHGLSATRFFAGISVDDNAFIRLILLWDLDPRMVKVALQHSSL